MYTSAGSDVFAAIKLAMVIYEKWFIKVNRADSRYMEFGNDIRFLHGQLKKLGKILEDVSGSQRQASLKEGRATQEPIANSQALEVERIELVGDFARTLRDCQKLLEDNFKYGNPGNGMILTACWYGTGIESQSLLLRQRIQFHCTKITFILQPLQLELLVSIDQNVQILKRQNREQLRILRGLSANGLVQAQNTSRIVQHGLPPIPSDIAERYERQAFNSRPFDIPEAYPLRESVNALLYHFGKSTVQVTGSFQTPTNDHFNNLLKARWILGKILESPGFRRLRPCLYRATVESVEESIEGQYERFDDTWDTLQTESLSKLEDEHFSIWVIEESQPMVPQVTDEAPGEIKILELPLPAPLGYSKQSLLVFRQTDVEYRILRTSIMEGGNLVVPSEKQIVNMHHFRFVPYYAIPGSEAATNNVWICHNQVHQGEIFDMVTIEDVLDFQQALTGYEVMFTNSHMRWEIQRDGVTNRTMRTKSWSGIQIWRWNPFGRAQRADADNESDVLSQASSSDTRAATLAEEVITNLPGKAASMLSTQNEDVLASSAPRVPVMVIFTYWKNKLAFFYVPLDKGLSINLQRCGCKNANSDCMHTVLEQKPLKKFSMRIHSVANGFDDQPILADWDLSLFGQPRHPEFQNLEAINDLIRLDLEFKFLEDRKKFQIQLLRTLKAYQQSLDDFKMVAKTTRHLDQKPNALAANSRRLSGSTAASASARPSISLSSLTPPTSPDPRKASVSSSSSLRTSSISAISAVLPSTPVELPAVRPIAELPPTFISELEAPLEPPQAFGSAAPTLAPAPRYIPWSPASYGPRPDDGDRKLAGSPVSQLSSTSPPPRRGSALNNSLSITSPISPPSSSSADRPFSLSPPAYSNASSRSVSIPSYSNPRPVFAHPQSYPNSHPVSSLFPTAEEHEGEDERGGFDDSEVRREDEEEEVIPPYYPPAFVAPLRISKKVTAVAHVAAEPAEPVTFIPPREALALGPVSAGRAGAGAGAGAVTRESKSRRESMRKAFFSRRTAGDDA